MSGPAGFDEIKRNCQGNADDEADVDIWMFPTNRASLNPRHVDEDQ